MTSVHLKCNVCDEYWPEEDLVDRGTLYRDPICTRCRQNSIYEGAETMAARDQQEPMMDPYRTILVCKHDGKEVGRVPATAHNAEEYMMELTRHYGSLEVDYEEDQTGGLLAMLHGPH